MKIETEAVEKMAREYKAALANYNAESGAAEGLAERAVIIIEEQLDIINALLNYNRNRQWQRLLSYLKSVKSASVIAFNKLLHKGEYIPSFRNNDGMNNSLFEFMDKQISLFVIIDSLGKYTDTTALSILENRAAAVTGLLCR